MYIYLEKRLKVRREMAAVDVAMGDTADVPEEASALMHVPPSPAVNPAHPVDQAPK